MTRTKHTDCTHPKTPAARAACRKGAKVTTVTPIIASPADTIALLNLAAEGHDVNPLLEEVHITEEGLTVRKGSLVEIMFRGDYNTTLCIVDQMYEDIKDGRPGIDVCHEADSSVRRWCYDYQVKRVITF